MPALCDEARQALEAQIQQRLASGSRHRSLAAPVSLGIPEIDDTLPLGGLALGAVHEWIGVSTLGEQGSARRGWWSPPLALLLHVALRVGGVGVPRGCVWVGEAVWPLATHLARAEALETSLCVRAPAPEERVWAADLALRSRAAGVVVADASGLDLASTRRLQLAAEAGGGVCLLARPPAERGELSAAMTRWMVSWCASPIATRRWTVELLRCKGMRPKAGARGLWVLEQDRATRRLGVAAYLADGPDRASAGARRIG